MAETTISWWERIKAGIKRYAIVALIILVLCAILGVQYAKIKELERNKQISDQNIIALNDSLRVERDKNGELVVSIAGYISTEKELKTINKELYDRVQAQKGDIISLNHVIVQLVQDTTLLKKYIKEKDKKIRELLLIGKDTYVAPWSLTYAYDSTNFDVFTGKTTIKVKSLDPLTLTHEDTELISRKTQIDLAWGQKVENGVLRVFIISKYPGFNVAQMEGVLIDPNTNPLIKKLMKEKHWFTGFSVGIGTAAGFNVTDGKYGLVIGPTLTWNIYRW
jgi:hypothetical protein